MAAGIVGDHRVGHAVLAELPGGERSALIARAGLVDPDMDAQPAVMRQIDRRRGGADVDGGEPAGIAMGEQVDRLAALLGRDRLDQRQAVAADRLVDGHILLADLGGAAVGGRDARGAGLVAHRRRHLVERPFEVDGGRARAHERRRTRARAPRRKHPVAAPGKSHRRPPPRSAARRAPAWRGSRGRPHRARRGARSRNGAAAASDRRYRPTNRRVRPRCCGWACRRLSWAGSHNAVRGGGKVGPHVPAQARDK